MKLPGEPGFRGLSEKELKDELQGKYEDLVAKKMCDVCRPDYCKHKECPEGNPCPCFKATPYDLWVEEQNEVTFGYLDKIPFRDKIR